MPWQEREMLQHAEEKLQQKAQSLKDHPKRRALPRGVAGEHLRHQELQQRRQRMKSCLARRRLACCLQQEGPARPREPLLRMWFRREKSPCPQHRRTQASRPHTRMKMSHRRRHWKLMMRIFMFWSLTCLLLDLDLEQHHHWQNRPRQQVWIQRSSGDCRPWSSQGGWQLLELWLAYPTDLLLSSLVLHYIRQCLNYQLLSGYQEWSRRRLHTSQTRRTKTRESRRKHPLLMRTCPAQRSRLAVLLKAACHR